MPVAKVPLKTDDVQVRAPYTPLRFFGHSHHISEGVSCCVLLCTRSL